jgi:hypothetical protein
MQGRQMSACSQDIGSVGRRLRHARTWPPPRQQPITPGFKGRLPGGPELWARAAELGKASSLRMCCFLQ